MRISVLACGFVSIISLFLAGGTWLELKAERKRSADLLAQLGDPATRTLSSQRSTMSPPPVQSGTQVEQVSVASINGTSELPRQDLKVDPVVREALFKQIRVQMPQRFPDLMNELGLTPEQLGQLFDLLVKQQEETGAAGDSLRNLDVDQRMRSFADLNQRQQSELSAMLGTKYVLFEEYKKTLPVRQRVASFRQLMESSGIPLRADQAQMLNATMFAERERLQQEERELGSGNSDAWQTPEQYAQKILELRAEGDRRVLTSAGSYLTEPQLQALRMQLESRAGARDSQFPRP